MANLHDISWGNRATSDNKKNEETRKNLEQFRAAYLIVWISLNAVYGYAIIYIQRTSQDFFILVLTVLVTGQVLIKLSAAIVNSIYECITACRLKNRGQHYREIREDDHKIKEKAVRDINRDKFKQDRLELMKKDVNANLKVNTHKNRR